MALHTLSLLLRLVEGHGSFRDDEARIVQGVAIKLYDVRLDVACLGDVELGTSAALISSTCNFGSVHSPPVELPISPGVLGGGDLLA